MYRSSWVEVDLDAFSDNLKSVKRHTHKEIICVIKADGYGAGDYQLVEIAKEEGINNFAVSSLDEAVALRNKGVKDPILILGYVSCQHIPLCLENKLTLTVTSLDWLKQVTTQNTHGLKVHLKIDTGMNRLGVKGVEEAKQALALCLNNHIIPEGIYTHFACSDHSDQVMTKLQFSQFKAIIESLNYPFKFIHASNSDAIFSFEDSITTAVRLGISMFGISSYRDDLKPVFSLYSTISCVKEIKAGETVSYGASYTAQDDEIIATLPIGYADGLDRRNQGRLVLVDGEEAEIIGKICMDQCIIRITNFKPLDTVVEFFGKNIPIEKVANEINTIPYEVLTSLSDRLTRIYIRNQKIYQEANYRLDCSTKK